MSELITIQKNVQQGEVMQTVPQERGRAAIRDNEVEQLTQKILSSWRRSVESLVEMGRCLAKIKRLLPRDLFLRHLDERLGMHEVHAGRLIMLYEKFHTHKSVEVLSSKPSVLYLLASNQSPQQIKKLAQGQRVSINGKKKAISEFTVKDAVAYTKSKRNEFIEKEKIMPDEFHRELATILEQLIDWHFDCDRALKKINGEHRKLIVNYISQVQRELMCLKTKLN